MLEEKVDFKIVLIACADHKKPYIVFSKLLNDGFLNGKNTVLLTDHLNGKINSLARKKGIENFKVTSNSELEKKIFKYQHSILISCGWPKIIPENVLSISLKAALNCHSSFLPDYKGASVFKHFWSNWESEAGATIHFMTKRLDEGNIVVQKKIKIKQPTTPIRILNQTSYPPVSG
jgi:folate-dependent phosphoribosylglycinamide formyltransferase PurN